MIQITKPFLPPEEEYQALLTEIWERNWLTNNGPVSKRLQSELTDYLGVENFVLVSNGTISLQMIFKALDIKGEVITTPFSYVATTSALVWEGIKPVFVDIEQDTFNIDPDKIEAAITSETTAILATHVFGCPCKIEAIEAIANKHNLKVIYDAAHAFGVNYKGRSIFNFGDVSSLSMHATKLFHTIEGGGIITNSDELAFTFSKMRNFGHQGFDDYSGIGINAKCSEVHAAMGVVNLRYIGQILDRREVLYKHYYELLQTNENITFQRIPDKDVEYNYSYFPVLFSKKEYLQEAIEEFSKKDIYPRRYFYPSLNTLNYIEEAHACPIAESISERVLCLPLFHSLTFEQIGIIVNVIKNIKR